MSAAVVAGMDASPVFEPAEHVLDLVPLAVEDTIMLDRLFAVGFRRDARRDAALGESLAEPVGVVALVAEQLLRRRSEEHTSELQSLMRNSYAVFCLKKKKKRKQAHST